MKRLLVLLLVFSAANAFIATGETTLSSETGLGTIGFSFNDGSVTGNEGDFYNTSITGVVSVKKFGELRLLGGANITMNGPTTVGELGLIQISDNVILHGNVDCVEDGRNSVDSGTPHVSSTGTINCGP